MIADRLAVCSHCPHRVDDRCSRSGRACVSHARETVWSCPLVKAPEPRRNLIFHCLPVGHWRDHVSALARNAALFTGRKTIAILTGPGCERPQSVSLECRRQGLPFDRIFIRANDPDRGESVTFPELLAETLSDPEAVTFYAHTKGVTRDTPETRHWTTAMFGVLLDQFADRVAIPLRSAPFVGAFRRYGRLPPVSSDWHYSGTFFWFQNAAVSARGFQFDGRHAVESWPGSLYSPHRCACVYAERCGCLYHPDTWSRLKDWSTCPR